MNKTRHIFSMTIVVILVVVSVNFLFPKKSYALVGFGAPIILVTPCTNGLMLTIGPAPSAGTYLITYAPPSQIYAFYTFKPGSWVLGGYVPGGVCYIPPAAPITVTGTIILVGTSL